MEKLIPISKRQAETVNALTETITSAQERLKLVASVLMQSQDGEEQNAGVKGARFVPGESGEMGLNSPDQYFLVLEVE